MPSHVFRQSNLDRIHSIMGIWVLTLILSLGILTGEEFSFRDNQSGNTSRGILKRHLPVVPHHSGDTVFALRSSKIWFDSSIDRSAPSQLLKSNSMSQPSPFERSTEPNFCEFNSHRQFVDLSTKLTNRRPEPVLYLSAESPFEQHQTSRADRKETHSHGASVLGGVAFVR